MREIETDHLVVGAGASGMAFVDALITHGDADVVMVDRRHRPGGHWLDAYPFVRLHQPSANYGVDSRMLGSDRIDETGPNAGFYERATAAEICAYFDRVLDEVLLPSGRVRFLAMHDHVGSDGDGQTLVSLLTGEHVTVKVRRKLVDATYVASEIPSRRPPPFEVDPDVRLVPPNDLVDLGEPAGGYTIVGAGKTAMDTCTWLMDEGVAPDRIRWIKPRDGWMMARDYVQPLEHVGSYMQLQARWVQAAAEASDGFDFARRLEEGGIFVRVDPSVDPEMFRGAILSRTELDSLRRIENVIRGRRVRRIGTTHIATDDGDIASGPDQVYVDCTAAGVPAVAARPIWGPDTITMQYATLGIVPWGAATIGVVEALRDDDAEKNRLCPPVTFTGNVADLPQLTLSFMSGLTARFGDPEVSAWNEGSRLNPARGASEHLDDPRVPEALGVIGAQLGSALENLGRLAQTGSVPSV